MSGTERKIPKFYEGEELPRKYFEPIDINNPPKCYLKLREVTKYAKEHNKEISDLTREEIMMFIPKERVDNSKTLYSMITD